MCEGVYDSRHNVIPDGDEEGNVCDGKPEKILDILKGLLVCCSDEGREGGW